MTYTTVYTIAFRLTLTSAECVDVGDNWPADIQDSKNVGIHAILATQHESYKHFEPMPGDYIPDARIGHFYELETILLNVPDT